MGSSNTEDVNNWFYCLSPSISHFHQPAGEHERAASNWVQLRVCDSDICEGSYCTKSLNYKHSYKAFHLQASSESCVPVQIQVSSYRENFPSFCFHRKPCVNPCLSTWYRLCSYPLLHVTYYNYSYPVQYKAPFVPEVTNQRLGTCEYWGLEDPGVPELLNSWLKSRPVLAIQILDFPATENVVKDVVSFWRLEKKAKNPHITSLFPQVFITIDKIGWMLNLNRKYHVYRILFFFFLVRNVFKFAGVSAVLVHQMFHVGKHLSMCFKHGLFCLEVFFLSSLPD